MRTQLQARILSERGLSSDAKAIGLYLAAMHTHFDGFWMPEIETVKADMNATTEQVRDAVCELRNAGYFVERGTVN